MYKKIICAALAVAIVFMFSGCFGKKTISVSEYEEKISQSDTSAGMPTKEDLEKCDKVKCQTVAKNDTTNFIEIVATYNKTEYNKEKKYYEEESLYFPDGFDTEIFGQAKAEYKGYTFRVLIDETFNYPKDFVVVGQSDENKEIIFIKVETPDLDRIDNLTDFLLEEAEIDSLIK